LIALDIDGVALYDTFSPIIYQLVKKFNGDYTSEIERNVFSQPQKKAARFLIDKLNLPILENELLEIYFQERKEYLKTHNGGIVTGLEDFLKIAKQLELPVICYGGLEKFHFEENLGILANYFDGEQYICTNDFRPGIKEIITQYYNYKYTEVLFIDDVNRVAEEAKSLNVPFIGIPSNFEHGFQRQDMIKFGVKYILDSIAEVNYNLLVELDYNNLRDKIWQKQNLEF
jgi:hypothetical protein